jgi:hypothetical protein
VTKRKNTALLIKVYKLHLLFSIATWIVLLTSLDVTIITLYTLFLTLSITALRMGFLAKLISISFYLFVFSRVAILLLFPDNFNFPSPVYSYNMHVEILLYSLYYYAALLLYCFLFEDRGVNKNTPPISKNVVTYSMVYMVIITIMIVYNNTAFSFSNLGYSDSFLIVKKIWNHSTFVLVVLLLFYTGFFRRVFLSFLIIIYFIYYPSKAFLFNIAGPILFAKEIRGKSISVSSVVSIIAIFAIVFALADTIRVNSYFNIEFFTNKIMSVLFSILSRVGFNYDMGLHYFDQFNEGYYAIDIIKSVINGYVPGDLFHNERILSGTDLHALEYGIDLEKMKRAGGGFNLGYFLFDRAYFGYYAPLISLVFVYPILKVYNKGNIVYKIIIAIGFFGVANSDSFIYLLKIINNIVIFYLFMLLVDFLEKIFKSLKSLYENHN